MENPQRPSWSVETENSILEKSKKMTLTEELKKEQLSGMRIFVVRNDKTGEVAPMTIIYGKDFRDYESFMDAVKKVTNDFYTEHGLDKDGLVLEDRWARSIEEFKKDNPELIDHL